MNGWKLGEEVLYPDGTIGTVEGMVRLHGKIMVIIQDAPTLVTEEAARVDGFVTLAMIPEEQLKPVKGITP